MRHTLEMFFESARPDILLAYLFGSRARGDTIPTSDYDIAVVADHPLSWRDELDLAHQIAVLLHAPKVDIVNLDRAPIELGFRVIAEGSVLIAQDEATRVEYEATIMSRYYDALPELRRQREEILREVEHEPDVHRYREAFEKTERVLESIRAAAKPK